MSTDVEVNLIDADKRIINDIETLDDYSVASAALLSDGQIFTGVSMCSFLQSGTTRYALIVSHEVRCLSLYWRSLR